MAAAVTSFVPESQRPSARCDETSFIAISVAESPLVPKISPGTAFVGDAAKAKAFVGAAAMGLGAAAVGEFVGAAAMGLGAAAVGEFVAAMAKGLGVEAAGGEFVAAMAKGLGAAAVGEFVGAAAMGLGAAAVGEFVDIAAAARDSAWSTSFLTLGSSTSSLTIGWICTIAARMRGSLTSRTSSPPPGCSRGASLSSSGRLRPGRA